MFTKNNIHELLDGGKDVSLRLGNSVLRHKKTKHAIYVQAKEGYLINAFDIKTQTEIQDKTYAWDLELCSPPTGFLNISNECKMVARTPVRKFKIGLTNENSYLISIHNGYKENFTHTLSLPALSAMFENEYPTYENALKDLMEDRQKRSIAFTRNLCFHKGDLNLITLQHYCQVVGWIPPDETKVYLGKQYNNKSYQKYLHLHGVDTNA